jgi:predicted signal transduction protein with EAL and GGDEF domain
VARWGGEEFVVLLPRTSALEAALIADRIRRHIESLDTQSLGMDSNVTVSIGVATEAEGGGSMPSELMSAADVALYRAKADGRNRVHVYTDEGDFETQLIRTRRCRTAPPPSMTQSTSRGEANDEATMALSRRA